MRTYSKAIAVAAIVVAAAFFLRPGDDRVSHLPLEISCAEVHRLRQAGEPMVLVDCREQDEYDLVSISGARLLPMSEMETRHQELTAEDQEVPLIVYCHHGGRSARVADFLRQKGLSQAQSMTGGIDAWAQEVEPGMARY